MKIREVGIPVWESDQYGWVPALKLNNQGEIVKSKERGYVVVERSDPDSNEWDIAEHKMYPEPDDAREAVGKLIEKYKEEHPEKSKKDLPYKNVLPLQGFIEEELAKAGNQLGFPPGTSMQVDLELTPDAEIVIRIGPQED